MASFHPTSAGIVMRACLAHEEGTHSFQHGRDIYVGNSSHFKHPSLGIIEASIPTAAADLLSVLVKLTLESGHNDL